MQTNKEALDVLSIFAAFPRSDRISARTIRAALVAAMSLEAAPRYVAEIDRMARFGERYSNECFDLLSGAVGLLARNGVQV